VNIKLLGLAFVLFALGCSSSSSYIPQNNWPSKEASEKLANRPLAKAATSLQERRPAVEKWALVGELPQGFGYSQPALQSTWETGLASVVSKNPKHRMSGAEMCVAQQAAAFFAAHAELPDQGVESFIGARCGTTSYGYRVGLLTYDRDIEPDAAWGSQKAEISKWVTSSLGDFDSADVGLAALNHNGELRFFLVASERSLEMDPAPFMHAGSVVVRGRSNVANTARIGASITNGEFGFATCERDSRISYPAFAFTCPVESTDAFAYVDFSVSREGRVLGSFTSRVLVAPATPPKEYVIPAIRRAVALAPASEGSPNVDVKGVPIVETSATRETFAAEVVRVVNHVRAQAGLEPLVHAAEQSKFNSKIAPFMFSEAASSDVDSENETAMAVLAGWNVDGFIVEGAFQMGGVSTVDPSAYVDSALESASGRRLLLGPGVSTLALGTMSQGKGVGVVASSYDFLPQVDFNRRVGEAMRDLNRLRAQRNLPPLKESIKLRGIARETATRIERNDMDLDAAGKKMAEQYMSKYNKGCRYWRFVVSEFDDMDFAKELIETQKGRVSILVAPYRPEGYAWGYYAIVIVVEN
jgi:uncharacterized protein YkwD